MTAALKEFLNDPKWGRKVRISKGEAPEFILGIYIAIEGAIRQNCSVIEVLDDEIRIKKQINELPLGHLPFPIDTLSVPSTIRRYFDSILSRDVIISSSLELIDKTDEMAVYRIL